MPGMTRTGNARDDEEREYPDDEEREYPDDENGGMLSIARPGNTRDDKPGPVWYTVGRGREPRHRRGEERT